jgi:hypothetical protein
VNVIVQKTAAELNYGLSLPHRKMEDWRWTDLRQLIDRPYPPRQTAVAFCKSCRRTDGVRQRTLFSRTLATEK